MAHYAAPKSSAEPTPENWVLYRSAAYLRGKGVSYGGTIFPQAAWADGVYSLSFGPTGQAVDKSLEVIEDASLDHLYLGPALEMLQEIEGFFRQALRKLKVGGHLVVYTKLGQQGHGLQEFSPQRLSALVEPNGKWQLKVEEERDGGSLQIWKRLEGRRGIVGMVSKPTDAKRVCVARYGAFGDAIIISPLLRKLKADGWHVTLNINPYCKDVFQFNPHIDNLLIQEREVIPNNQLMKYWRFWAGEYDKYINLSESLEGELLIVEGRQAFFTHKSWRHEKCNENYYDYVFKRAGFIDVQTGLVQADCLGQVGEIYFSAAEERRAMEFFRPLKDVFTVVWALNGSSHHKVYPLMEATLTEWFKRHPDSKVLTVGDYMAKLLEFEHPQLLPKAGEWKIRESLLATKYASLVIGPETAITNASGCFETPKIVLLSHSTKENLTKYFKNDFSLEPSQDLAPCYPCHQLHYTKESCPEGTVVDKETSEALGKAPICTLAISPQRLLGQMEKVYELWKSKRPN